MRPLLLLTLPLSACYAHTTGVTTYTAERWNDALTMAPTGPHAYGPFPEVGAPMATLAVAHSFVASPTESRAEGAPGQTLAGDWVRGMMMVAVSEHVELGADLELAPGALAHPLATDLSTTEETRVLLRGGPHVRLRWDFDGFFVEGGGEVGITRLPYLHTETLTATRLMSDAPEFYTPETETLETSAETRTIWAWNPRGAVGGGYRSRMGAQVGALVGIEGLPIFDGYSRETWTCTEHGYDETTLKPFSLFHPTDFGPELVASATLWGSVPLGSPMVQLVGAGRWFFTDNTLSHAAPYSAELGLRVALDLPEDPSAWRYDD